MVFLASDGVLSGRVAFLDDASLLYVLTLSSDGVLIVPCASLLNGTNIGTLSTRNLLLITRPLLVHIGHTFTGCLFADSWFAVFSRTSVLTVLLSSVLELDFIDLLLLLCEHIELGFSDPFAVCSGISMLRGLSDLPFGSVSRFLLLTALTWGQIRAGGEGLPWTC